MVGFHIYPKDCENYYIQFPETDVETEAQRGDGFRVVSW